ncbi:exodeoxyribonuclease VII large subunit [Zoogloea ramigera]|uniref:exodeoxyribonuclease VII large subunit n=1 Tax=Zoogloea ramigera TaxID=350 RepID=UPI003FA339B0
MNTPRNSAEVKPGEVVSVSWLNRAARNVLEESFPLMWIAGEVSTLTRAASGHVYFTLKDEQAQVRCTMWRNRAQLLPFRLEHGMQVEVRALVSLFEPRGDYQLNVEAVRHAGVGNLYEAFLRLKARLEAEGLFEPAAKRALPRFPRGIAVVTSAQAAAWRDVTAALARRAPHVPITLYPTPVQGDGAPAQIAAAIRRAGRSTARDGTDVLLLVRGGGSLEDLAAFNSEAVARAIRACPLPVVVGVGHETDVSIADFPADLRAATPTAAAELASAGFVELHDKLALLDARLTRAMQRRVETAAQRLDRVAARLTHPRQRLVQAGLRLETLTQALRARMARQLAAGEARVGALGLRLAARKPDLAQRRARLEALSLRLERAGSNLLERRRSRLDALAQHLAHLDPRGVLARGYSITRNAAGVIVRDARRLSPGGGIRGGLHQGSIDATVDAQND